jgi:hypothetical protein
MIYVDTSVALAQLLAEDCCPPAEFWESVWPKPSAFLWPTADSGIRNRGLVP